MYESFYELGAAPFENTPDPRFFFESEQHREALAAVEYTIRMRKGFVVITGAVGTGKTTVGQTMRQRCGDGVRFVQITYGCQDRPELLRQIHRALRTPLRGNEDHAELIELLQAYLLQQLEQNRPVVLFIDEAQTFSDAALDELRLLSNLDTWTSKAVQIALVGQPELRERLRNATHAALRQRIVMAKTIEPLNHTDTSAYIHHRLAAASVDSNRPGVVFGSDAITAIYQYAGGLPRLINIACDNCLLMGFVQGARQIGAAIVHKVMAEMIPSFETPEAETHAKPRLALAGGY